MSELSLPGVAGVTGPPLADPLAEEGAARLALSIGGDDANAWFSLGVALHAQRRLAEALEAFRASAECAPSRIDAHNAAAVVLSALGRDDEALEQLQCARALGSDDALALAMTLANTGVVLSRKRLAQAALDAYAEALEVDSTFAPAMMNRVPLLASLGRLDAAREAALAFVETYPEVADGHYNLAEVELARRDFAGALAASDACLAADPRHARAHVDRGLAHAMLGNLEAADADMLAAEQIDQEVWTSVSDLTRELASDSGTDHGRRDAEAVDPRSVVLVQALRRAERCDWAGYETLLDDICEAARGAGGDGVDERSVLFTCWATPVGDAVHRPVSRRVAREIERRVPPRIWTGGAAPGERIRIGYLSPDVRDHAAGYALRPLLRSHDRARFEITVYSLLAADASDTRADIEASVDALVDLSGRRDEDAAWRIFRDGCDVLVDFAGYTRHARPEILAYRPAAVQASYHGYHASMGGRFIDYHVTSATTSPPGEADRWVESRCFLPDTHFVYDDETEVSAAPIGRADVGLPEQATVYCCFNQPFKIEPESFDAWMRVLDAVPGSVLWLLLDDPASERALRREAGRRGVSASRLVVAPGIAHQPLHLARTALADVYLDTFWFNGHTTLADALWAGVPAVTRLGTTPYGRLAAGMLEASGLARYVARDTEAFIDLAVTLGTDPAARAGAVQAVARARESGALFDVEARARALEAAFEEMVRRHRSGEGHSDLAIAPVSLAPCAP